MVLIRDRHSGIVRDCSKSSRQCSLYYLLTYLPLQHTTSDHQEKSQETEGRGRASKARTTSRKGTGKQERKGFTMRDRGVRRPRGNLPDIKFPRRKSSKTACRSRRASGLILMPTNSVHDHLCVNLHAPAVFGCSIVRAMQVRDARAQRTKLHALRERPRRVPT